MHSNQYQQETDNTHEPLGSDDPNAYTLTLSQAVMPDRADEIASAVARSPIDRFEHSFQFDNGSDYLAWSVATEAQRNAAHHGYDPVLAGIEAFVIGPASSYGRLDDFFANQPSTTPTRLVVCKQNVMAGAEPIRDHLGPDHQDCYVGGTSLERSVQASGRTLLSDLVKAIASDQVYAALDGTRHPYSHSLGFLQRGHHSRSRNAQAGLGTLELDQLAKIKLPEGYDREAFSQDVHAVKAMMMDLAAKAGAEAQARGYDNASQAYGFADELQSLYQHLCHGRHAEALQAMSAISPYLLEDLPHRLYEHLEASATASPTTPNVSPGIRYTRVDLEGRANHYASMTRKRESDTIKVDVLCPGLQRTHCVQAGIDSREDQRSMAEGLQQILDGHQGDRHEVGEYYDALIRLAD